MTSSAEYHAIFFVKYLRYFSVKLLIEQAAKSLTGVVTFPAKNCKNIEQTSSAH